jgi:hypothetical protein
LGAVVGVDNHGLTVQESVGLGPRAKPRTAVAGLVRLRRGRLAYRQVGERLDMRRTRYKGLFYLGHALH